MQAATMVTDAIDLDKHSGAKWDHIDAALRTIAKRRGALDAIEAKWLREALRVKIWREVGCVSMADYLERRLGYAPRTAHDRVRVALALESLPKIEEALNNGLPHSAVRELTRVVTDQNEQKWLDAIRGKTVHEIENMVAGRGKGSDPEDPPHPNLVGRTLPFEGVRPATMALLRDARRRAQEDRGAGEVMSDDEFLATITRAFLEGNSTERTKAPYQIAVTICEHCNRGWQESGGRKYELSRADLERACCDAERIGSLDPEDRKRAVQDVSPSTRRLVHRRDGGRCKMPGCRSTRCLEMHHIVARILGGTHDPENIILSCDACHTSLHRGLITITGTASALVVTRRYPVSYDQEAANDEEEAGLSAANDVVNEDAASELVLVRRHEVSNGEVANDPDANDYSVNDHSAVSDQASNDHAANDCSTNNHSAAHLFVRRQDVSYDRSVANDESAANDHSTNSEPTPNTSISIEPSAHAGTNSLQATVPRDAEPSARFERERIRVEARSALTGLGFRPAQAGEAVKLAIERLGEAPLEDIIREALRCCPRR